MSKEKTVKIGGFYWLTERLRGPGRTGEIIKISRLGNEIPQLIEGEIFDTLTGGMYTTNDFSLSIWDKSGRYVFACEIGDRVSKQELTEIITQFSNSITSFFTPKK